MKRSNNKTVYAVGYCRFSDQKQNKSSIEDQKKVIQKYADANGIIIRRWYLDYAQTATTTVGRKEFLQMIEDSKQRNFSLVLVYQLDRFARQEEDHIMYRLDLQKNGAKVFSVMEQFGEDPEGKLLETIMQGITAYFSRDIGRKVTRRMTSKAEKAEYNGGQAPFGYKLVEDRDETGKVKVHTEGRSKGKPFWIYAIDEETVEGARLIFDRVLEGVKLKDICWELKDKGYKTRMGNDFTDSSLGNILRNERYTGMYFFKKRTTGISENTGRKARVKNDDENIIRVEGGCPQIISKEKFDAVQRILDDRVHRSPGKCIDDYHLNSRIFCGECGAIYRGDRHERKNGEYRNFYKCNSKKSDDMGRELPDKCTNCAVDRDIVERSVLESIRELLFRAEQIPSVIEMTNERRIKKIGKGNEAVKKLEAELVADEKDLNSAITDYIRTTNDILKKALEEKIEKLTVKKADTERRLEQEKNEQFEIKFDMGLFKPAISKLRRCLDVDMRTPNAKRNKKFLIDSFVNRVLVYQDRIELLLNALPQTLLGSLNITVEPKLLWQTHDASLENALNIQNKGQDDAPYPLIPIFSEPENWLENNNGSPGRI